MNIYDEIQNLLNYGKNKDFFEKDDEIQIRNALLEILELDEFVNQESEIKQEIALEENLENIIYWAKNNGVLKENTTSSKDILSSRLMGTLLPRQSEISKKFKKIYKFKGPIEATNYFYKLSHNSNYIQSKRIEKNKYWKVNTEYGDLEITINLSKPEKDPKEIERAKYIEKKSYPKCFLCKENVGYIGHLNHPGRKNHRIIPLTINHEQWYYQYSPYIYFEEHSIIFSDEHREMKIEKDTFIKLLDFIEIFPHYFIGSNADLPIVGGSILSHEHFQGGRHSFGMEKAPIEQIINFKNYPNVTGGIVKWPMSVIRLQGKREDLLNLASDILDNWKKYTDKSVDIFSHTDQPHNTITPIVRMIGSQFEMDLVLRNNRKSKEYPFGIFHPHEELHNIKKENIGLIEVMGLAVLPARLNRELQLINKYLEKRKKNSDLKLSLELNHHKNWIKKIITNNQNIFKLNEKERLDILKNEVGKVFLNVLLDAGVFKRNKIGKTRFKMFLEQF